MTPDSPRLYPYQLEGVEFLTKHRRCLLADDPGLGKTAQSIVAARKIDCNKILVLCPKTILSNWRKEIFAWERNCELVLDINLGEIGAPLKSIPFLYPRWVVTNWDKLLTEDFNELVNQKWDLIIADECQQALKSWTAKRCQLFIKKLAKQAERIWLLSATPSTRSAADYHPMLSLLSPGQWEKFGTFQDRYCKKKPSRHKRCGFDYYGFANKAELRDRIKKQCKVLRRKKEDVLPELPEKIYQTIHISTQKELLIFGNQSLNFDQYTSPSDLPFYIATVVRQTGEAKVDAVVEHALTFPSDVPLAIFAWHKSVVDKIKQKIKKEKLCMSITGDTKLDDRQLIIQQFQQDLLPVLVMNMQCGGVGLNLQNCSHCSFAELPWSPAMQTQAEDRFHRIGTKSAVNIYKFVAVNSIDEAIIRNCEMKQRGMNEVMAA